MKEKKKMSLGIFVLMILTSVFGINNIGIGFYKMGYAAIPLYLIGGLFFFIPYVFMLIEFSTGFRDQKGGMYTWMEKSVNIKFAFVGIVMWYTSYVIWLFNKAITIWVPLSYAIFGKDVTINAPEQILGILGILLVLVTTYLVTLGSQKFAIVSSIGGISIISLNILLLVGGVIAFVSQGIQEPLTYTGLFHSPNADYQSGISYLGFLVFAIFAYGGIEAIAGVSEDLENPKRDTKKGILIAGIVIILCYIIGFIMVGSIMSWGEFGNTRFGDVNSINAIYIIMGNLGVVIGQAFGGDGHVLGEILIRFAGLGEFIAFFGAVIALTYAPLKQLIEGTPKELWSEKVHDTNEKGMLTYALKFQAVVVIALILIKVILTTLLTAVLGGAAGEDAVTKLFDNILAMSNISMTVPYLFLVYAYYKFRINPDLPKDIVIIKSKTTVLITTIVTFLIITFSNVFSIIQPLIESGVQGIEPAFWTVIGPVVFGGAALIRYNKRKHLLNEK